MQIHLSSTVYCHNYILYSIFIVLCNLIFVNHYESLLFRNFYMIIIIHFKNLQTTSCLFCHRILRVVFWINQFCILSFFSLTLSFSIFWGFFKDHQSLHELAFYVTSCILLLFQNPTTCHLSNREFTHLILSSSLLAFHFFPSTRPSNSATRAFPKHNMQKEAR